MGGGVYGVRRAERQIEGRRDEGDGSGTDITEASTRDGGQWDTREYKGSLRNEKNYGID